MHKKFLFAVALIAAFIAGAINSPLALMACGLLAGMAVITAPAMYAVAEPRAYRYPPDAIPFRTLAIGGLVMTLIAYGMILPVALHIFTGVQRYVSVGLMAGTIGFVCGWVACALRMDQNRVKVQAG